MARFSAGKELIARAIHNMGCRSHRPFVAVSCGAIPEPLIFGYEKGALTDKTGARQGFLEEAEDGTLFLDEISELSQSTQVTLLRVLQQREFSRLGSHRLIPFKARVVIATHQDLSDLVAQGKMRQDLFYRINVMRINIPSLREHPGDIPQLATHFLLKYSEQYQRHLESIQPDALALLEAYAWPGNVRELENVIQRAIILVNDKYIRVEDLPQNIQQETAVSIDDYFPTSSH